METVDFKRVIKDVSTDKFDIYLLEFPDIKANIEDLKKNPGCGSCVAKNIPPIFNHPKFTEKMKMIYGDDVKLDTKNLPATPPKLNQKAEVINVPLKEWENWWKNNMLDPKKQVRLMTTFFNPKNDTVVVSMISISPETK